MNIRAVPATAPPEQWTPDSTRRRREIRQEMLQRYTSGTCSRPDCFRPRGHGLEGLCTKHSLEAKGK